MPEWLESLLVAIGGGAVVLVGVLTIFKGLLVKLFETGIESSFEKNLEKFKNNLDRTTRAYEILLDREMRFYEKLEPITAKLVPLEHDLLYYLKYDEDADRERQSEAFKEHFKRYCELIKDLKNENLIHQSYIPQEVFNAFTSVVKQMQDDMPLWFDMAKFLFAGEYDKIDYEKCETTIDTLLMQLAFAETMVRKRLKQLSGES
ncbi:MAG: hypothetical protein KHY46_06000 [Clostridiales bacterium]|nr:hypothetical protein [Clostridiales bacterium]